MEETQTQNEQEEEVKISPEDFLKWLCKKRIIEENGVKKIKSFRFGRSIWIIGRQSIIAKEMMTSKSVVNELFKRLEEGNYLHYVGLWTYEMTNKGLTTIESDKTREYKIPSDYNDYVVSRGNKNGGVQGKNI